MMQVKDVAHHLGLNPQTLYFYERIGLIPPPPRTEAGYRLFSQQDVERLAFITHAKTLGLSLDEIRDVLTLKEEGSLSCKAVYERLWAKVQDIQAQIEKLQALHDDLMPLMVECKDRVDILEERGLTCTVLDQPRLEKPIS